MNYCWKVYILFVSLSNILPLVMIFFLFFCFPLSLKSLPPYDEDDDVGGDGDVEMSTDESCSDEDGDEGLLPQFDGASDKIKGIAVELLLSTYHVNIEKGSSITMTCI